MALPGEEEANRCHALKLTTASVICPKRFPSAVTSAVIANRGASAAPPRAVNRRKGQETLPFIGASKRSTPGSVRQPDGKTGATSIFIGVER